MSHTVAELKQLLKTIFADSIVEPKEREALGEFTKSMTVEETAEAFQQFLKEKWGEIMADDVITGAERALLVKIMHELSLALEHLPLQARHAMKDHL